MSDNSTQKNRFGNAVQTEIPEDAPRAHRPGHKLRTSNDIVDRSELGDDSTQTASVHVLQDQKIELIRVEDQVGLVRISMDTKCSIIWIESWPGKMVSTLRLSTSTWG